MAETKVVRKPPESVEVRRLGPWGPRGLFNTTVPFGDLFSLNPFALMREFTKEMDCAFSGFPSTTEITPEAWAPAVEVKEVNGNLIVTAELPGIKKEDVKLEITEQALIIEGERKQEKKEEKEGFYRSERIYGRFFRSVPLPEGVKTDQVKAELNNGVLEVTVPIPENKQQRKQIPITEAVKEKTAAA